MKLMQDYVVSLNYLQKDSDITSLVFYPFSILRILHIKELDWRKKVYIELELYTDTFPLNYRKWQQISISLTTPGKCRFINYYSFLMSSVLCPAMRADVIA